MTQAMHVFFIRFTLSFALVFAHAGLAAAGPAEDTQAAYKAETSGDYENALRLYERAAAGGDRFATNNLGDMYYAGRGVKRSWVEAMKWYRQAADKGQPDSQYAVGGMYERGESVRTDAAEALKWYLLAANQGHLPSQNSLGIIYTTGAKGVETNLVQAYLWFSVAGKEDRAAASRRDRTAAKLTPAQLAEAEELVNAWKPKK